MADAFLSRQWPGALTTTRRYFNKERALWFNMDLTKPKRGGDIWNKEVTETAQRFLTPLLRVVSCTTFKPLKGFKLFEEFKS